jgi:23S rRNA (cytidine1920-2'-O)/16S rRNA (cytidine1409-2'-O)-methyltransferase
MKKERLDILLYRKGLAASRQRASTEIMSGNVLVDGQKVDKPGTMVPEYAELSLIKPALPFVSRGGLKLEKALDEFQINPEGKICIDCGASTGGFTDCLLKRGAKKVYAVDVGYGQLAWSLRTDPRVVIMERTNIRYVTEEQITERLDLAVIDVSFISLRLVLPPVKKLLAKEGEVVCLIKPQFEAGKEKVGKKGVVRDKNNHIEVLESFIAYSRECGFDLKKLSFSPIKGPQGNIEYLGHLVQEAKPQAEIDVIGIVNRSHDEL